MSHELTISASTNRAEMAYVGERPWHGLGQQLQADAPFEDWQAAAGMDWRILRSKVRYFADRDGATQLEVPDQHVLFRSDTKAPLGLVSSKYKTVQPAQVLEFFKDLVGDAGFTLETAGTLFGGKKFWALANIGESANIVGSDQVGGYLLLSTSCDGSSATSARLTTVRVVCNNTLSMATSARGKKQVDVSHRTVFDGARVKDSMGVVRGQFAEFVDAARALTTVKLSTDVAETFVRQLLRPDEKAAGDSFADLMARGHRVADADATKQRSPRGEQDILRLFNGAGMGDRLAGVHGTGWGMLNAVTEYVDHRASARSDSHRLNSAWFNGGDDLKTACFERLLAMV